MTPNKKQLNHLGGGIFISAELTLISISGRPVFLCFVFSFEISGASDSSFLSSSLSSSLKYSNPVYRKSFNPYWQIFGHDTGRFLENSPKIEHLVERWYSMNSGAWDRPICGKLIQIWTSVPEIGPAHAAEIKISKKYWMSIPEIGLCHAPENWNFGKIFG